MSLVTLKHLSGNGAGQSSLHHHGVSQNQMMMHSQFDDLSINYPNQSKRLKYGGAQNDTYGSFGSSIPEVTILTE
jgi:hypothetical protein